jgi:hypothetical protein
MMQAEAQGWADAFNKRRPPKEVQFLTGAFRTRARWPATLSLKLPPRIIPRFALAAFVCELIDRPGKPICNIEKCAPLLLHPLLLRPALSWAKPQRSAAILFFCRC